MKLISYVKVQQFFYDLEQRTSVLNPKQNKCYLYIILFKLVRKHEED